MERNTKEIITPKEKHKILMVEWISGREGIEIDKPILNVKMSVEKKTGEINLGEAIRSSKEIAIKIIIVSIDGDSKNILDRVLDMPKSEYEFVIGEVDKVISGEDFTKPVSKEKGGID